MSEHPSFWSNCRLEIIACVIWLWKQGRCRKLWRKMWDHHIDQNDASVKNKKKTEPERASRLSSYKEQRWNPGEAFIKGWLKCKGSDLTKEQLIFCCSRARPVPPDLSERASECSLAQLNEAVAQSAHRWGISQVTTKPLDNILEWLCWAGWVPAQWNKERKRKHCVVIQPPHSTFSFFLSVSIDIRLLHLFPEHFVAHLSNKWWPICIK